jgi:hypothetical protein
MYTANKRERRIRQQTNRQRGRTTRHNPLQWALLLVICAAVAVVLIGGLRQIAGVEPAYAVTDEPQISEGTPPPLTIHGPRLRPLAVTAVAQNASAPSAAPTSIIVQEIAPTATPLPAALPTPTPLPVVVEQTTVVEQPTVAEPVAQVPEQSFVTMIHQPAQPSAQ